MGAALPNQYRKAARGRAFRVVLAGAKQERRVIRRQTEQCFDRERQALAPRARAVKKKNPPVQRDPQLPPRRGGQTVVVRRTGRGKKKNGRVRELRFAVAHEFV